MAVIVSSSIDKSGPTISGDTVHMVVVQTNPGYAPNPGDAGTGTVIGQICRRSRTSNSGAGGPGHTAGPSALLGRTRGSGDADRAQYADPDTTGGERAVKVFQREQQLRTTGGLHVRDITGDVAEAVDESGVQDGIACVYSPHTTCCVRVNEFEQGFLEDFAQLLLRLVPRETYYAHDDWDRRTENICPEDMDVGNGHSHCMAMLLGTAGESIPIRNGELQLGRYQRVLFIELDRERDRRWLVQVVGH
jgi:secondary thiamine-phosphate synthase enzyme